MSTHLWNAFVRTGFRAAPGWMAATLALAAVTAVGAAAYPYGFRILTDGVIAGDDGRVLVGASIGGGLVAVYWAAATLDANVGFGLTDRVSLYVSSRIAELVNRAPGLEHLEREDYQRELDLVIQNQGMLAGAPRQLVSTSQTFIRGALMVALLATVDLRLMALPIVGLVPTLAQAWSVRVRQAAEERLAERKRLGDQLFTLAATAGPAKELRIYGMGDEVVRRHSSIARDVERGTIAASLKGSIGASAGWVVFIGAFVAALIVLTDRALAGEVSAGEVIMAIILAQQVRIAIAQMATSVGQLLTTTRTVRRVTWLESFANTAAAGRGVERGRHSAGAVPERLVDGIELRGVSFTYAGTGRPALSDVSVRFPAGATVALVGTNGAGKSTIAKLLCQLYDPTAGAITVDGLDLHTVPHAEWRSRISIAAQDYARFELIARESIGVGDLPSADDEAAVLRALDRAEAGDLVTQLDAGLDTQLGRSFPSGRELSGGQWQKVALGRGMMRPEPLLLVLDEPTASLDAETESALFRQYANAAERARTNNGAITLLISHRFSTVRHADLIAVIDDGTITEYGTHAELLALRGTYAELFELQARAYR